jgi:hypothetical protein
MADNNPWPRPLNSFALPRRLNTRCASFSARAVMTWKSWPRAQPATIVAPSSPAMRNKSMLAPSHRLASLLVEVGKARPEAAEKHTTLEAVVAEHNHPRPHRPRMRASEGPSRQAQPQTEADPTSATRGDFTGATWHPARRGRRHARPDRSHLQRLAEHDFAADGLTWKPTYRLRDGQTHL